MVRKAKCMADGGFTFAEMKDEDRMAAAKAAAAAIDAREAEKSADAKISGVDLWTPEEKPVKRSAPKPKAKEEKAAKEEAPAKSEAPRSERAPSSVKAEPITGPKPAKSAESAMPDVAARKAATAVRQRRSAFGGENKGVYGMSAGGKASSASRRADGCAVRGKTKGRMV